MAPCIEIDTAFFKHKVDTVLQFGFFNQKHCKEEPTIIPFILPKQNLICKLEEKLELNNNYYYFNKNIAFIWVLSFKTYKFLIRHHCNHHRNIISWWLLD